MTVGIAQNRINEMNSIARKLADCIEKINSEENEDKIESLEKYGITKEYAHWECVDYGMDLAKFLGYEIKMMNEEN